MRSIKFGVAFCLMVCLMFTVPTVGAEIRPGAITLSPMIGGYVFEGNQDLDNEPSYGIGLGYHFNRNWAVEAVLNYIDTELDDGRDVDTYLGHIDFLYHFMPSERFVPYIAAGVGAIIFDVDSYGSDPDLSLNYGAGLKYFLTDNIALRGDVRHVYTYEPTQSNLLYTVGLTFLFGGQKEEVRAEAPKPVEMPKPKPVEAPKPKVVEPPKDSDGDGVPDSIDRCPNTPKGATVNEVGCWVCKGLNFDFDKWDIKPQYYACLKSQVDLLKRRSDLKVEIQGHTDNYGSQKYNQVLSEKRAMAVMNYLVSKGIAKDRLSIKGFGFSDPVDTNKTEEGRAKNRRVQFNPISR